MRVHRRRRGRRGRAAARSEELQVEPGFLRWGETLTILRPIEDESVAVEASSTWELGRRGPPSGTLIVRRDHDGIEIHVDDRLRVRLDKKCFRGAWLDASDDRFVIDIDTGLNADGGSTRQIRGPVATLPRAARRRPRS